MSVSDFEIAKKIAIFDIESTSLKADRGRMLACCFKEVNRDNMGGKIHTVSVLDPRNTYGLFSDRWVVRETVRLANTFDLLVGWNSSRFDFPFINTRATIHGIVPPERNFRRDLLCNSRGSLSLSSHRLANVGETLLGESGKSVLKWALWEKAMQGDKASIKYIVDHCQKDVTETERIYKKFMPMLGKLRKR